MYKLIRLLANSFTVFTFTNCSASALAFIPTILHGAVFGSTDIQGEYLYIIPACICFCCMIHLRKFYIVCKTVGGPSIHK